MRRKFAVLGAALAVLGAGLTGAMISSESTQAAAVNATFIVPANDGYGIGECVSSGSGCARVVADAWCEAQGFVRSASFGVAEITDVTASIGRGANDRPITITCAQ